MLRSTRRASAIRRLVFLLETQSLNSQGDSEQPLGGLVRVVAKTRNNRSGDSLVVSDEIICAASSLNTLAASRPGVTSLGSSLRLRPTLRDEALQRSAPQVPTAPD